MKKFAADNMRVGTSLFALTPDTELYWLSSKEGSNLTITTDIKMGFLTSIQEKDGAYLKLNDNCSLISPELYLFTVKGFVWDDDWECYRIAIESNL